MNSAATERSSKCAACGTEGDSLKSCAACKLDKYCNAACQKAHRPRHKKKCRQRAAELFDEALFNELPRDECPICFVPFPFEVDMYLHKSCCGKVLCIGCIHGIAETWMAETTELNPELDICPYCREQTPNTDQEATERLKKRMECGDGTAFTIMGSAYETGSRGLPIDLTKSLEMWIRAGELGCATGYYNAGNAYYNVNGQGVQLDEKKAKYYYGLAAIKGNVYARNNLGAMEGKAGNYDRALKHFTISARAGFKNSLDVIKAYYLDGFLPKEEFEKVLRAYQASKEEVKSDMRDGAMRAREQYRAAGLSFRGFN